MSGAKIFTHNNYVGPSITLTAGNYPNEFLRDNNFIIDGNPQISSCLVDSGYRLELYTGKNYTGTVPGESHIKTGSNISIGGYNDNVKSLKVVADAVECFQNVKSNRNINTNFLLILLILIIIVFYYITKKRK